MMKFCISSLINYGSWTIRAHMINPTFAVWARAGHLPSQVSQNTQHCVTEEAKAAFFFKVGGLAKWKAICIDHVPKVTHTETVTEKHLLDIDEWLPVSGAPASNVGADEDSRGISNVESPLADGSTNGNTV